MKKQMTIKIRKYRQRNKDRNMENYIEKKRQEIQINRVEIDHDEE